MFWFCAAFHKAPLILNAFFCCFFFFFFSFFLFFFFFFAFFPYALILYPALLVVLFWLAFLSVSLPLVCFSGVVHMSQPVASDFTHNCKQVVNRLKIPQGLSTLLFHRWSEVPSRGGVHGDSPYEKLPALQRCHLSVFSKCCFYNF